MADTKIAIVGVVSLSDEGGLVVIDHTAKPASVGQIFPNARNCPNLMMKFFEGEEPTAEAWKAADAAYGKELYSDSAYKEAAQKFIERQWREPQDFLHHRWL